MSHRLLAAPATLLCAWALAACQNTPPSANVQCRSVEAAAGSSGPLLAGVNSPQAVGVPGANSVLIVPGLGSSIAISQAEGTRTAVGNPAVRLELANCSGETVRVRLRTQFMDSQARPTEPVSAWKEVVVLARSVAGYDELGTQRPGTHFRVELDRITPGEP